MYQGGTHKNLTREPLPDPKQVEFVPKLKRVLLCALA